LHIVKVHVLQEIGAVLANLRPIAHNLRELIPGHHLVQICLLKVLVVARLVSAETLRYVGDVAHVVAD